MFGSVTRRNVCQPLAPSTIAASSSSVPCSSMSGISSRATKGKVTKIVASTMPGTAKMIADVAVREPGAEPALGAEEQHVDHAGDHRRDRERQIDQREQHVLAGKLELRDRPRGRDAEDQVERHRDRRREQREAHGRERLRRRPAPAVGGPPLRQRLGEDRRQRQDEEERQEGERDRRERPRGRGADSPIARLAAIVRRVARRRPAHWSRLMPSRSANDTTSMTTAIAVAPGVVVLLQLGHDEERRDLGPHRHVAGDEDDRAVLAEGPRERQREAGEDAPARAPGGARGGTSASGSRRGSRPPPPARPRGPRAPAAPCAPRTAAR